MTSRSKLGADFLAKVNSKSSEDENDAAEKPALKLNLNLSNEDSESNPISVKSNTALFQSVINKNEAYPERDKWLVEGRKHKTSKEAGSKKFFQ